MKKQKNPSLKKQKEINWILPYVTQFYPAEPNLKQILVSKWHLIELKPVLKAILEPPYTNHHHCIRCKQKGW